MSTEATSSLSNTPKAHAPKRHSDAEIWNACASVLGKEQKPLEVWRVADATQMPEDEIVAALMRETLPRREAVTFRFPPLPCAAITALGSVSVVRVSNA